MGSPHGDRARRLRRAARLAALAASALALIGLSGHLFGLETLRRIQPGLASMKANTALALLAISIALQVWLASPPTPWARRLTVGFAAITAAIAGLTLVEWGAGLDLGIDQLAITDPDPVRHGHLGRMSIGTATCLLALSIAVLTIGRKIGRYQPTVWLAYGVLSVASVVLVGYAYGAWAVYEFAPFSSTALHTGLALALCSGALVLAYPQRGVMNTLTSDSPAGIVGRRLLPAAVLLPVAFGSAELVGEHHGVFPHNLGVAIFAVAHILVLGALIVWSASSLNRAAEEREAALDAEHRAARALRDSEARKVAVMEAALDAIVLMDGDGVIIDFNPAAERLFGHTRAAVVGRSLANTLVPPAMRDAHRDGLTRHLATGAATILGRRVEVPGLRSDGTVFPAEVAVVRIAVDGPPVFTGYIRDLTERRNAAEAENLRVARDAAEAANAELESFSYSVAHDLRAPLRAIAGFAKIVLEDHAEALGPLGARDLEQVVTAANDMGTRIDALLSLARFARAELTIDTVDLAALAREVVDFLRASHPDRPVEFVCPDSLPVRGDARLLRAAIENLLSNAWKFTGKRAAPHVELGRDDDGFFVRDNGAGFDMGSVHRLFNPFSRLHRAVDFEGTGVGLATVQRIIRRHGGRIWADAEVDGGATFHFTISPPRGEG